MSDDAWSFLDPEDSEVIMLGRILRGEAPLLLVTHDEDDGGWQFLDGEHVFEDDPVVVWKWPQSRTERVSIDSQFIIR